ncbi:hypothetical protein PSE_4180 [Pseudovibrio sp. FO-BEG1]|nr:hypothetical protein PSE_4180 [Pseudovibrio sp. FO-BEG1]
MPNAIVMAFGDVAESYLKPLNIDYIKAYSLSPPAANYKPAKPSWTAALTEIQNRRRSKQGENSNEVSNK